MKDFFSKFNKIVLVAGHGGIDSGAISPQGHREADQVIFITDIVAKNLRDRGLNIEVCPHNLDLQGGINWINARFSEYNPNRNDNTWILEFHRDWANPNLPQEQRDNQIGIYYFDENRDKMEGWNDGKSVEVAKYLLDIYLKLGAFKGDLNNLFDFNGSWIKDHYLDWVGYNLGFLELTKPFASLIEHGFMSGRNDNEHLTKLANWTSQAIFETFTGQSYTNSNNQNNMTQSFNDNLANTYMKNLDTLRSGAGKKWWDKMPDVIKRAFDSSFDPCYLAMELANRIDEIEELKKQLSNSFQPDTNCQTKLQEIKKIIER